MSHVCQWKLPTFHLDLLQPLLQFSRKHIPVSPILYGVADTPWVWLQHWFTWMYWSVSSVFPSSSKSHLRLQNDSNVVQTTNPRPEFFVMELHKIDLPFSSFLVFTVTHGYSYPSYLSNRDLKPHFSESLTLSFKRQLFFLFSVLCPLNFP